MGLGRPPKVRDFIHRLKQIGCKPLRIKGSHQIWATPGGHQVTIVCNHMNTHLSRLVLSSVENVLQREGLTVVGQ